MWFEGRLYLGLGVRVPTRVRAMPRAAETLPKVPSPLSGAPAAPWAPLLGHTAHAAVATPGLLPGDRTIALTLTPSPNPQLALTLN